MEMGPPWGRRLEGTKSGRHLGIGARNGNVAVKNRAQMLETLSILRYSPKGSENPSGAGNQQGNAGEIRSPSSTTRSAPGESG